MKTTFDQTDILAEWLIGSVLESAVSGGIYANQRPEGSVLEDVVCNSITTNTDQIQLGTSNVNLYVADTELEYGGKRQFWPNVERLKTLTDLAVSLLVESIQDEYDFELKTISPPIPIPELKQHYVNLRVDFKFYPITT